MSQRSVARLLGLYFVVIWVAMLGRVDHFPLTWAPMYAVEVPEMTEPYTVPVTDKKRLDREGFAVIRRDGSTGKVTHQDLNVTRRSVRRLYYHRAFGTGPPNQAHRNHPGWTLERQLLGLDADAPPLVIDWPRRLLVTVNKSLGLEPDEAGFIVGLSAYREELRFDPDTLKLGARDVVRIAARWDEAWDSEFASASH